jgi:hypothetical protein
MKQLTRLTLACCAGVLLATAPAARGEDLSDRIERMERELQDLKQQLREEKAAREQDKAAAGAEATAADEKTEPAYRAVLDDVKVGGYGSLRFEDSDLADQKDSFVFRRFVLTADANIAPRLRANVELEFERFRKLEVEQSFTPGTAEQGIEATNHSEISLEQAWLQYDLASWLKLRTGAILVPLGRFNISHDDNRWDLPRRSLVDRGVPVLPSTAAWDELGVGFNGDIDLTDQALLSYQLYVMNGVSLDSEFEQKIEGGNPPNVATEVKLSPSTGGFATDVKDAKAVAGRIALSPKLGQEIAGSWYCGQYTPDFLGHQDLWSVAADGRASHGPFELEGEGVFTRFEGTPQVAAALAQAAIDQSRQSNDATVTSEAEFELSSLARNKYGYWLEARYHFWPEFLNRTVLGQPFANPQLTAVLRGEQVWLDDLVGEVDFSGGSLTTFDTSNRRVDRFTVGLAYRPVPLVVFQLAYEYTQTNNNQSLAGVTNYLPARPQESNVNTVMLGTAFGF